MLQPLLLPAEAGSIFSRVAAMFSGTLVEAFGLLEARGPAWELQLKVGGLGGRVGGWTDGVWAAGGMQSRAWLGTLM